MARAHTSWLSCAWYASQDIRDLLSKNPNNKLELKETPDKGVYVKDLMQFVVKSQSEINSVLHVSASRALSCLVPCCVCGGAS